MWRRVILGRVMHLCGCAAVIHGRARGGHCDGVRQAWVVATGPPQELGAVVYSPILGHGCQGWVTHRPQAGVLTVERERLGS